MTATEIIEAYIAANPSVVMARQRWPFPPDPPDEFYDRNGEPIVADERLTAVMKWGILHEDRDYQGILKTQVGPYWISTVWLGMNHNWGRGRPLIFETMAFGPDGTNDDLDMDRYATEAQARIGHAKMVAQYRKRYEAECWPPG